MTFDLEVIYQETDRGGSTVSQAAHRVILAHAGGVDRENIADDETPTLVTDGTQAGTFYQNQNEFSGSNATFGW